MTLVQKEIKAVYLWENKVRPPYQPRTFTISWTEKSNMSSWWTYSDDAAWLTAWDTAFDEFFWYYGCRLNTSGVETAKVTQEESWWAWKLDITRLWTLTSWDNVMIAFPVRWIKMSKSGSTVTLSITEELGKDWYQYYAFQTWQTNNITDTKDKFYLWAYKWYSWWTTSSYTLKSRSWQSPTCWTNSTWSWVWNQMDFCTMAGNNGSWYNIIWFYQRQYINALYMMKYWNPNSQSVIGNWYTSWRAKQNTWATNSITNATWATSTSSTWRIKLFWLEDRWGNIWEWIWWAYIDSSYYLVTALSWYYWTLNYWVNTFIQINFRYACMSSISWTNLGMLAPISWVNNSNYNTYYTDLSLGNVYTKLIIAGWDYLQWAAAWIFWWNTNYGYQQSSLAAGSRLVYL